MKNTLSILTLIALLFSMLLAACVAPSASVSPHAEPTTSETAALPPTNTSTSTATSTSTSTPMPPTNTAANTATATSTSTFTPTPAPVALTVQNVSLIQEYMRFGQPAIYGYAVSGDGATLVLGTSAGLEIYAANSLAWIGQVSIEEGIANSLGSPQVTYDGQRFLAATKTGLVVVDRTGAVLWALALQGASGEFTRFVLSPDGQYAAVADSLVGQLKVYAVGGGAIVFQARVASFSAPIFSGDSRMLAFELDRSVHLVSASDWREVQSIFLGGQSGEYAFRVSQDGSLAAVLRKPDEIEIWNVTERKLIRSIGQAEFNWFDARFAQDGQRFIVYDTTRQVYREFDIASGELVAEYSPEPVTLPRGVIRMENLYLRAGKDFVQVVLWYVSPQKILEYQFDCPGCETLRYPYTVHDNPTAPVVVGEQGQVLYESPVPGITVYDLLQGRYLLIGEPLGCPGCMQLRLWDTEHRRQVWSRSGLPIFYATSPDQSRFAVKPLGASKPLYIVDVTGREYSANADAFAFANDGRVAMYSYAESVLAIHNSNGASLQKLTLEASIYTLALSSGSLVFWSEREYIIAYDMQAKQEVVRWQAHTGSVLALALSPDEKFLASISEDGFTKVWAVRP